MMLAMAQQGENCLCWTDPSNSARKVCFCGEVPYTTLTDGATLAQRMGLTSGTPSNSTVNWFKFSLDGATLYIPKKPLRQNVVRTALTNGRLVSGDRAISLNGNTYKVRLLKGLAPGGTPYNEPGSSDPWRVHKSEWNRLLYNIWNGNGASQEGPKFARYTNADLASIYTWVQEANATFAMTRAGNGLTWVNSPPPSTARAWLPALELVE